MDSHDLYELDLQYCDCTTGVAVPNPSNQPGLVSDCEALLASRDTLAGAATLNWSADIPIADWDGVTVSGTPGRVMELALQEKGLKGRLPSELGSLTDLVGLNLFGNDLRGPIPLELGTLAKLQWLYLAGNQLTGCVPDGLRDVPENDLAILYLPFCYDAVEPIVCVNRGEVTDAANTGVMTDCEALLASRDTLAGTATLNWSTDTPITDWDGITVRGTPARVTDLRLTHIGLNGAIPAELGNLDNLRDLRLSYNELSGPIPAELGNLENLRDLQLSYNELSGPIPDELRNL